MNSSVESTKKGNGRIVLIALVLVFSAPIVFSYLWKPTGFVNYGDLIEPARPLEPVALADLNGEPFPLEKLNNKWTLVYLGAGVCPNVCRDNLYNMRQVRLAQGKNAHRVRYAWIVIDSASPDQTLLSEHPGLVALTGDKNVIGKLMDQFETEFGQPSDLIERVYLIDPIGNLMMSFAYDINPSLMLKDLKRLLKVSQLGTR